MALAPTSFGVYGGDLLGRNLGDGLLNVYDATTFAQVGQLDDAMGKPVLYRLAGAGIANSGDPAVLYFSAGLNAEQHGLFGRINVTVQ